MYVTSTTTTNEIKRQIKALEEELEKNKKLSKIDRFCLYDELDYLRSFLPRESW